MELCLGTVQFGMNYGINNQDGQPSLERSVEMLQYAASNGITMLDTAAAYQEAETVVGHFMCQAQPKPQIVSKLRPDCLEDRKASVPEIVREELMKTLQKLKVDSLYGYLLHNAEHLYNDAVMDTLRQLKAEGLIQHYGVSIYQMKDGFAGIERGCSIIQLPFSVFDQRARCSGLLEAALEGNVEIHTRSAFLQGLLMMDVDKIPGNLSKLVPYAERLNEICQRYSIEKKHLLIGFVKQTKGIDRLVFGVDNINQLEEFIDTFREACLSEKVMEELNGSFGDIEEALILPSKWGK